MAKKPPPFAKKGGGKAADKNDRAFGAHKDDKSKKGGKKK